MSATERSVHSLGAPDNFASRPIHVLVAFDGSSKDAAALRWALHYAESVDASVEVIHALGLRESSIFPSQVGGESDHDRAVRETEASLRRTIDADPVAVSIGVHMTVLSGDPRLILLRAIESGRPALVVIGRRAASDTVAVLGSVSREIANASPVPVVVVPQAGP